ncbi:RDD family protein [Pseudalkalibacillus berkeleyi]|uniref:RDD family protein n=1 Tax=Pseudalkalibacillus berkeleyi TaxID=1069813 RepID=A0ABS9H3A4_9BACL|nr:RDD family protein [Pseudalkalibacillus berkeleyi]MCF6138278.1 RDD family protein [Pseudalkalibacillus berkeleyi]
MVTQPAGFWRRLFASILDGIIIGIPAALVGYLIVGNMEENFITGIIEFLYTLLVPVFWVGYTIGKRILGIRIAKVNGNKVGIGTMLMRTVVSALVYAVTLGIGLIISAFMVGLREDKRSIHDFIAGTYVTHEKP